MKNQLKFIFFVFIGISLFSKLSSNLYSQNTSKYKVRIQAYYFKIMDSVSYIDIKAISRIDKKNTKVTNIDLSIFNILGDEKVKLGNTITNMQGEARFIFNNLEPLSIDSTNTINIQVLFNGNSSFRKASKKISFKNATIIAKLETRNNVNYINAHVINENSNAPIIEEPLTLRVQRLFKPLILGDNLNITDVNGTILIPVEKGIPGVNGNLVIEVVLDDSDDFGTVIDLVKSPIGVPIVDESTFDERTMWSPRNKTPIFLLVIPNILTFGMWGIIILLIFNLLKIKNS